MSKLYLLCGKPGCGKSTLARFLEHSYNIIHFSADDYMTLLFGEIKDKETFESSLLKCKEIIFQTTEKLLHNNNDVVLDFGFWYKNERLEVANRFKNQCQVILIYLKIDEKEILKRIFYRNSNLKDNEYYMDEKTFRILSDKFEEPDLDEDFILYKNNDDLVKQLALNKE